MELNQQQIKDYWQRYIAGYEAVPDHIEGMDDALLASWKRSKRTANPYETETLLVSHEELDELYIRNKDLINVAFPYMMRFFKLVKDQNHEIVLTDHQGKQLKCINDAFQGVVDLLKQANVKNGAIYTEETSGTNAVSLCLYEDKPVLLRGYEHYQRIYHDFVCYSAPIHTLGHQQIGCICLVGPLESYQPYLMDTLLIIIEAIENELRMLQTNSMFSTIVQHFNQGVFLLDAHLQILEINDTAKRILSPTASLVSHKLTEYVDLDKPMKTYTQQDASFSCIFKQEKAIPLSMQIIPIEENQKEDLYLVLFTTQKQSNRQVANIVGYHAQYHFDQLIASSSSMKRVKELGKMAAYTPSPVLIVGERGTGKEVLAQAIHNEAHTPQDPFIPIYCSSISKPMLDKELFGDENQQKGKLELAQGGTLFLDEVEAIPLESQIKLSAYLKQGHSLKIIASTRIDLLHAVENNEFLNDLYYRLNIIHITIPPLRQRKDDIEALTKHYMKKYAKAFHKEVFDMEKDCLDVLCSYPFKGNVRELESIMERMVSFCKGSILKLEDLPVEILQSYWLNKYEKNDADSKGIVSPQMKEYQQITACLKASHGHVKTAANAMHMPLSTFYRKLEKYDIHPKDFQSW